MLDWLANNATPILALLSAILVFLKQLQAGKKLDTATAKVDEVHVLVNSRMSDALTKIAALETRLAQLRPDDARQAGVAGQAREEATRNAPKPPNVLPDHLL